MPSAAQLFSQLRPDPARVELQNSPGFAESVVEVLDAGDDRARSAALRRWLTDSQPCLFGRIAAKLDMLEFCWLTETILLAGDDAVRDVIQDARGRWWAAAMDGKKSGFIVSIVSDRVSRARPDENLRRFGQRICELYLLEEEVQADRIYLDEIFLSAPDRRGDRVYRWKAGVNVFAACADRRWWHDHRMPVGLAFSVNSVGHMVKSAQVNGALREFYEKLHDSAEELGVGPIESLPEALRLAMSTINNASETNWGKATWLCPASDLSECGPPPIALGKRLETKNHCKYEGTYHTDHTVPSSYFRDSIQRPADVHAMALDFTYLFVNTVENPAYRTMGAGERIRGDGGLAAPEMPNKAQRQWPTQGRIQEFPLLMKALEKHSQSR